MKVLWFCSTPPGFKGALNSYNGEGWVDSLFNSIKILNVNIAISFINDSDDIKILQDNTLYYPLPINKGKYKYLNKIATIKEKQIKKYMLRAIEDFNPDVIQVFGTENLFGIISQVTSRPVVIHMQGFVGPYFNAFFPPNFSLNNVLLSSFFNLNKIISHYRLYRNFKLPIQRELDIFQSCNYFMGRTDWDLNLVSLLSNNADYFICNEVLRSPFYNSRKWELKSTREKIIITTTISHPLYKGFDLILKTAKLLKEHSKIEFEWNVYGNPEVECNEKITNIKSTEVNVINRGIVNCESLIENLLNSDFYVHSSYIDNSPNSICEAQMLGLPVISTNVGGISSLIENEYSGILVPANDPYHLASKIISLIKDIEKTSLISKNGREVALVRHNKNKIVSDVLKIYHKIITVNGNKIKN